MELIISVVPFLRQGAFWLPNDISGQKMAI